MLNGLPGLTGLLVLIALAPGLVSWWRGRALMRLADDAALPERLLVARRQHGGMLGAALVLLFVVAVDSLPWTLPLLVYASIGAGYPLRKALYGETWSLAGYLGFVTRLFVGVWGFWIALIVMPMLAAAAGSFDLYVAMGVAIVLTIWNVRYAQVLRSVLNVRPIEDPALLTRFHAMVQASGIPMPRFERVDLHGGAVANAIALPSLDRSSVLFSETLLDRLEPDETVAICAHELAHLEHFNAPFLRRLRIVDLALIASGAAVAPAARFAGFSYLLPLLVWLAALLGAMVWRARDRQRNETASDLRAVALCEDSEALVRGLTRLYTMARVPRRMEVVYEQRATHPSLARRIRDIRAAAGTASASLEDAASFAGTDGHSVVTFEDDKLQWREGEGVVHSLSYAYLAELRVDVRGTQPASLVALERAGRRWELTLSPEDVTRAQAVLDVVDARLPAPEAPKRVPWPKLNRTVLALFVAMLGVTAGQLAVAFVTLLALLQPAPPLIAAAGMASLTGAGLLFTRGGIVPGVAGQLGLMLAALGLGLLYVARSNRAEPISRRATVAAMLLGACATLSVAGLALGGFDPVRLHQSARSATGAPVLLLAFASALVAWRSRIARYAAIPVIIVAAATSVAASSTFLDRFGEDPFLAPAEPIAWKIVTAAPVKAFAVPFIASALHLSPSGSQVAIATGQRYEQGKVTFYVGRDADSLTAVVADDLVFVDDEHVMLLRAEGGGVEVSYSRVDSLQAPVSHTHVDDLVGAQLSVAIEKPMAASAPATRKWRVMGWTQKRRAVRADGIVGASGVERTEWPGVAADEGWMRSMTSSGSDALFVESRYDPGFLYRTCLSRWMWLFPPDLKTVFRVAGAGTTSDLAVSQLDAACFPAALGSGQLLCSAFDGTRTRFIGIDPASKRVAGLAWMDGRFYTVGSSSGEWVSGWRDHSPVAFNMLRRQAVGVDAGSVGQVFHVAGSARMVGALGFESARSVVKLYRLE